MMLGNRNRRFEILLCAAVLACATGSGCRLFDRAGGSGGRSSLGDRPDPLMGGSRIPATNLPTGKADTARGVRDPLMTSPVSQSNDLPGGVRKDPYRPSRESTAAGLAAGTRIPADYPDRRATGKTEAADYDRIASELRRLRVKFQEPTREGGEYVVRGEVLIGTDGSMQRYEGSGTTAADAAKELLEQIQSGR